MHPSYLSDVASRGDERSLSHVPKAEAAAATGAGDSYNDVPKLLRQFHVKHINGHKKN